MRCPPIPQLRDPVLRARPAKDVTRRQYTRETTTIDRESFGHKLSAQYVNISIIRLRFAIALVAFCTLVLELSLVRVFDVILTSTMGYVVVTATVFALGLGGIYLYVLPIDRNRALRLLPFLLVGFSVTTLLILPVMNALPFKLNMDGSVLAVQIASWMGMYLTLIAPFFIAGVIITMILTHYSSQVHSLYFFDLVGAGMGCVLLIPLIAPYGPGGIQFLVAGVALLGVGLFVRRLAIVAVVVLVGAFLSFYPATRDSYLEYRGHADKRGVDTWITRGMRDYSRWDPVSKLDVLANHPGAYNFALDGGQQGSWLQQFDGDFGQLHGEMSRNPNGYFFGINSVVHYLMRDRQPEVLIIGAAVGGETKAALLFGARRIDAIELVGEMIKAAKTRYASYSGNVFNHPLVEYRVGEGRTFLRASNKQYDVIQMFSNHTSSSIADGSGAVGAAYLQTVEAYVEYFTHLSDDGIIQINHHIFPRMLTTAAEAWQRLGNRDFSRHVLVLERWHPDTLPTVLIKKRPWTEAEVAEVYQYLNRGRFGPQPVETLTPSPRVYQNHPFTFTLRPKQDIVDTVAIKLATYLQAQLAYDVQLEILQDRNLVFKAQISGAGIHDNEYLKVGVDPPLTGVKDRAIQIVLRSQNADSNQAFSVWQRENGDPVIDLRSRPAPFVIAFHPLDSRQRLIPAEFLDGPFPERLAAQADYLMSPVTDDNPYFGMIRKQLGRVSAARSLFMDGGTEFFLNTQVLPFLSSDWVNLFIVGMISLLFTVVFIFVPLFYSNRGRARWLGMEYYLIYFSCLGAGFIIIELAFVQLFKKLIGFPTHTYATVIFAMLFSAGIGSLLTKPLRVAENKRWVVMFILLLGLVVGFLATYAEIFHVFLAQPLPIRIAVAVLMLFPIGLVMGMPLPLAISKLGRIEPAGIPWAWGMNGFFTVFGGFLSVVLSFLFGYFVVLLTGVAIYALAFWMFARFQRLQPV